MRSDKQQMSYVPQCTEHVSFTSIAASTTAAPVDITVPPECIVEKVVVIVKTNFNQLNVDLSIGSKTSGTLFTPTPIDVNTATSNTEATPQVYWVPVSSLPDRTVRFSLANATAAAAAGAVYAYVVYRFPKNDTPTRVV